MATMATLVSAVQAYTVTTNGPTVLDTTTCEECVNTAMRALMRTHNFRGQQVSFDTTFPAGTDGLALPATFVKEYGVWTRNAAAADPSGALGPLDKTMRQMWIEEVDPQVLRDTVFPSVAAPGMRTPTQQYYIWALKLYLVPTPTADVDITIDYWSFLVDLTGAGSNWFTTVLPDTLRMGAIAEAYRYLHEEERATAWMQLFSAGMQDAIRYDESLAMSGPVRSRGKG